MTEMVADDFPERSNTLSNEKNVSDARNAARLSVKIANIPDADSESIPIEFRPLRRSLSTPDFVDAPPLFSRKESIYTLAAEAPPFADRRPSEFEIGLSDSFDEEPIDPMQDIKQRKRLVRKRPKLPPSGKSVPENLKEDYQILRPTRPLRSRSILDKNAKVGTVGTIPEVLNPKAGTGGGIGGGGGGGGTGGGSGSSRAFAGTIQPSFVDDIFPLDVSDNENSEGGVQFQPNKSVTQTPEITTQAPTPEEKQEINRYEVETPNADYSPLPRFHIKF